MPRVPGVDVARLGGAGRRAAARTPGGWADPARTVRHLADSARAAGAQIAEGVEVTGIERGEGGVEALETSHGRIACERLLLAPGPWAAGVLGMLGEAGPEISYWKAQEGEFELSGGATVRAPARIRPLVHLDQAGPLRADADGRVLVDGPWGIYFRVGAGGASVNRRRPAGRPDRARARPLRTRQPRARRRRRFRRVLHLRPRHGDRALPRPRRRLRATLAGGIVSHTGDNYPVCDWLAPNAYAIVDSGHGFKLLALGHLAADELLGDKPTLGAFRLCRFTRGETHPASKGPYPWT